MIINAEIWHTSVERDQGYRLFFKNIQWSSPSLSSRSQGDYVQGWAQGRGRDSALEYRLKRSPKFGEKLVEEKKKFHPKLGVLCPIYSDTNIVNWSHHTFVIERRNNKHIIACTIILNNAFKLTSVESDFLFQIFMTKNPMIMNNLSIGLQIECHWGVLQWHRGVHLHWTNGDCLVVVMMIITTIMMMMSGRWGISSWWWCIIDDYKVYILFCKFDYQ